MRYVVMGGGWSMGFDDDRWCLVCVGCTPEQKKDRNYFSISLHNDSVNVQRARNRLVLACAVVCANFA